MVVWGGGGGGRLYKLSLSSKFYSMVGTIYNTVLTKKMFDNCMNYNTYCMIYCIILHIP